MTKFVALGVIAGVLSLFAARPAHACGSGGGGSCSMSGGPAATASAKSTRSYSYAPSDGAYRSPMRMGRGMMGGGMGSSVPRSAGAKVGGN